MKRISFHSISGRFLASTLVMAVVVLVVIGLIMAMISVSSLRGAMDSKGNALADFMAKMGATSYLTIDFMTMEEYVKEISRDPEVAFAVFTDSKDNALTMTRTAPADTSAFAVYERTLNAADGSVLGKFRLGYHRTALAANMRKNLLILAAGIIISIVIFAVGIRVLVGRIITTPLTGMSQIAEVMAAGNLSLEVPVKGRNEISDLGGTINKMSANLREMLQKVKATSADLRDAMNLMGGATVKMSEGAKVQQEATEQTAMTMNEMIASNKGIAENAAEMSQAATDASSSATEMAASIEEVARSMDTLATAVDETASSIEEMIVSIRQVSENTDAVSASAEQTSSSITEMGNSVREVEHLAGESARLAERVSREASERGMVTASEAITGMRNIKEAVEATAEVLNRLGSRSKEIGQILKVIDEVTDQTGLLALNAAILAAQAGEQGKGFAVVAEEIKDLAERTASSTQEISGLIASVQKETAESLEAMNRGLKAVDQGVDLVNVTSDMLSQVADSSQQSAERARAIEKATAEQAKSVSQITQSSMVIAEQLEKIAGALQEQRKGSGTIAQAVERMRDITQKVRNATQEQTKGSRQIASAVESVTRQASQVAHSTAEQSQGAQQVSEAVNRIQAITQDTVDVSIEMDMASQTLKQKADALEAELGDFKF
jgi:methyl-accepting chemotaxis protein